MMKSSVELIMSIESSFRNMYRKLFAIETGNDFWKKVICEMTIREIQETLDDRTEVLSDLDMKVSLAEIQCLEGYLEKYSQAVPVSVDMKWNHDEYEAFMGSDMVRKGWYEPDNGALVWSCCFHDEIYEYDSERISDGFR